ncbi:MAG: hypothetical protein HY649_09225 [Acidobacteria bacterium]|nr:hypothetical protein [Acidobacteriota bacterium]
MGEKAATLTSVWQQVREILKDMEPDTFEREAGRSVFVALLGENPGQLSQMQNFIVPARLQSPKPEQVRQRLFPLQLPLSPDWQELLPGFDLVICSPGAAGRTAKLVPQFYVFDPRNPGSVVREILRRRWDLALPLAMNFLPFRRLAQRRWIESVALENTLFAVTAKISSLSPAPFPLADLLEGALSQQPSVSRTSSGKPSGEKGSSVGGISFLLANQMRMAFLIAASSDSQVGFRQQRGQITAITAAMLGWRALTGQVANRFSPGASLLVQGLLTFVQTYAVGLGLVQLHALGRSLTREEKSVAYEQAYRASRKLLDGILDAMVSRSRPAA